MHHPWKSNLSPDRPQRTARDGTAPQRAIKSLARLAAEQAFYAPSEERAAPESPPSATPVDRPRLSLPPGPGEEAAPQRPAGTRLIPAATSAAQAAPRTSTPAFTPAAALEVVAAADNRSPRVFRVSRPDAAPDSDVEDTGPAVPSRKVASERRPGPVHVVYSAPPASPLRAAEPSPLEANANPRDPIARRGFLPDGAAWSEDDFRDVGARLAALDEVLAAIDFAQGFEPMPGAEREKPPRAKAPRARGATRT